MVAARHSGLHSKSSGMSPMDRSDKLFALFLGAGVLQETGREADAVAQQEVTMAQARSESGGRGVIQFKVCFGERPQDLLGEGSEE